jgi:hypothetical protein
MTTPPWLEWRLEHATVCIGPNAWRHDKARCPQQELLRICVGTSFNGFLGLVSLRAIAVPGNTD